MTTTTTRTKNKKKTEAVGEMKVSPTLPSRFMLEEASIPKKEPLWVGWFDGIRGEHGTENYTYYNVNLSYWNHVVNAFPVVFNPDLPEDRQQDNPERYTSENYIKSLHRMIDETTQNFPNAKFFIDIPLCQVYPDTSEYPSGYRPHPDGGREYCTLFFDDDFYIPIIKEFNAHPNVIGWYTADEPEVWGYRERVNDTVVNEFPPLDLFALRSRYMSIRNVSSKPQLMVFCDLVLMEKTNFFNDPFLYDIIGFDHYPFKKSGTTNYKDVLHKFFYSARLSITEDVVIVGQGIGAHEVNGNSLRSPSVEENTEFFQTALNLANRYGFNLKGFLLWSASYATKDEIGTGNSVLFNAKELDPKPITNPPRRNWFQRVIDWIKNIFS